MARKKAQDKDIYSEFDSVVEAATEAAQKKRPHRIFTGGDEHSCLCLPVPGLAVRYLFKQEGLPLERFFLLDGPKESFKSAFGYELIRWHRLLGGKGEIIEVENKESDPYCLSINNYDAKAYRFHRCDTMQDWNKELTQWIHIYRRIMDGTKVRGQKATPGLGRKFPVCFMVDSIMAAIDEDDAQELVKQGHAVQRHPRDAKLISEFLKVFTKWIPTYPFTVVGVNHVKPTQDKRGFSIRSMPGGKAPEYHAAVDIGMTRLMRGSQRLVDGREYVPLRMTIEKNSTAPKSEIDVKFWWKTHWEQKTDMGESLQLSWFDWETASTQTLIEVIAKSGAALKRKFDEILGIQVFGEKGSQKVSSTTLDIPEKNPVNFHKFGEELEKRLQADNDFCNELYPLLGIQRRYIIKKGIDYREQIEEACQLGKLKQISREKILAEIYGTVGGDSGEDANIDDAMESPTDPGDPFDER